MKILPLALVALALVTSCQSSNNANKSRLEQLASQSASALNAKDYSQAQSFAAQATNIDPQFAEGWVACGMASVQLGQIDRARDAYEHALALHESRHRQNPSNPDQVVQQIFVLSLLGRSDEADAMLKQAQKDYPKDQQITTLAQDFNEMKKSWAMWSIAAK
jgi:Flp pilus assembly protein TadD